jgi:hypothetical protein
MRDLDDWIDDLVRRALAIRDRGVGGELSEDLDRARRELDAEIAAYDAALEAAR